MSHALDLSREGRVIAVAADRGHHFRKPPRDQIVLVEGHGVEGDAHAGPAIGNGIRRPSRSRRRRPGIAAEVGGGEYASIPKSRAGRRDYESLVEGHRITKIRAVK